MKLTSRDKQLLAQWGHTEEDYRQIEYAMLKSKTVYEVDAQEISREEVLSMLGRESYLRGISRSAFHYTAIMKMDDGRVVHFDSSKLFR